MILSEGATISEHVRVVTGVLSIKMHFKLQWQIWILLVTHFYDMD